MRFISASALLAVIGAGPAAAGECPVVFHEPGEAPYRSLCDSPWCGIAADLDYFVLETFEDGALNARGLAGNGGVVGGPYVNRDSVDLDGDGSLDGAGASGFSYVPGDPGGGAVARMSFDEATLGALPTHAGVVWTDGLPDTLVTFEAFDRAGVLIGTRAASLGDAMTTGTTGEDRFFGVEFAGGVSAISLSAAEGFMEIDHVQYGFDSGLACVGDLDGNGVVDFDDILRILSAWGACPDQPCCDDLNADGTVDFDDLLIVLAAWGPCP